MDEKEQRSRFQIELLTKVEEKLEQVFDLWDEMGITDSTERRGDIEQHVLKLFNRMVSEEQGYLNNLLKAIEHHENRRIILCKELGLDHNVNQVDEARADMRLLKVEEDGRHEVERLNAIKDARLAKVKVFELENAKASAIVGMRPFVLPRKQLPSEKQLEDLKANTEEMIVLGEKREIEFAEIKSEIVRLHEELETEPDSTSERSLVCEEKVILSASNLQKLTAIHNALLTTKATNKKKADNMRDEIKHLYFRLNLDEEELQDFLSSCMGFSSIQLERLEEKLRQLAVLKREHMKEFILAARNELVTLWNQCHYSRDQQCAFTAAHSQNFTEKLLEEHEEEVKKLKNYYDANVEIFTKVEEWQDVWRKMNELKQKLNDPSRLFTRGRNNLLQEEKDKRKINMRLPKVEKELFALADRYEFEHEGEPFLLEGVPLKQYCEQQVLEHSNEAMCAKEAKKDLKRKINEHETIYGSLPVTPGPSFITKTPGKSRLQVPTPKLRNGKTGFTNIHTPTLRIDERFVWKGPVGNAPGTTTGNEPKRRKMHDSIITGNLVCDLNSVASTACYKSQDVISSTMLKASGKSNTKVAKSVRNLTKVSTPATSRLGQAAHKRTALAPMNNRTRTTPLPGNKTLRSGKTLPYLL